MNSFEGSSATLVDQTGPYTHAAELLSFAMKQVPGTIERPRLLDLRCGTGRTARLFAQAGWEVVGVDCCPQFANSWIDICELYPGCKFLDDDAFSGLTPWSLGQFDLVIALDDSAVEFLESTSLLETLEFANHSLRRGGHFVYQLERSTSWSVSDPLATCVGMGFEEAWRASPVDLGCRIDMRLEHCASRDIIVAKR